MIHPLEKKLVHLRRRMWLIAVVHGLVAVAGIMLALMVVLGTADYFFQFQHRGLRICSSLAFFGTFVWTGYRYFFPPAAFRLRNVDLAKKLQKYYPDLKDRLLSAVEFMAQADDEPTAGSPALRRWVIEQTAAETKDLDFNRIVNFCPVVRATLLFMAICATAIILALLDPTASRTAAARLINPFNNIGRPQKNRPATPEHKTEVAGATPGATVEQPTSDVGAGEGGNNFRFTRDLSQLLGRQRETARRTAEIGGQTLGKAADELSQAETGELLSLASRQIEHARSFDSILQDMRSCEASLRQNDPPAADALAQALAQADREAIATQMRSCADSLRQNQTGQAAEQQKKVIEHLREIMAIFTSPFDGVSSDSRITGMRNSIKNLYRRQEDIQEETRRLETARQSQGRFNRPQLVSLVELAKSQRSLQADVVDQGSQSHSKALKLAIDEASRDMAQAADLLQRRMTGAETQQTQQNALDRLKLLQEVFEPEASENQSEASAKTDAEGDDKNSGNARNNAGQPQNTLNLTDLKLLKILQQEINRRTAALAEAIGLDGKPSDQQRQEFAELAEEQRRLSEMILKMMKDE